MDDDVQMMDVQLDGRSTPTQPDGGDGGGAQFTGGTIDKQTQADTIRKLGMPCKLEAGKTYYLLDVVWFFNWQKFVGFGESSVDVSVGVPKSIDHTHFFDNDGLLKRTLTEYSEFGGGDLGDFVIVSEQVWNKLATWYGGGVAVPRVAIKGSEGVGLEVHLLRVQLHAKGAKCDTKSTSKYATVGEFKTQLCKESNTKPDDARIWDYFNKRR